MYIIVLKLGRSHSAPQARFGHPSLISLLKRQINSGKGKKKLGDFFNVALWEEKKGEFQ